MPFSKEHISSTYTKNPWNYWFHDDWNKVCYPHVCSWDTGREDCNSRITYKHYNSQSRSFKIIYLGPLRISNLHLKPVLNYVLICTFFFFFHKEACFLNRSIDHLRCIINAHIQHGKYKALSKNYLCWNW